MKKDDYDSFINLLGVECGIIDSRVVSNVYSALVRLIISEIAHKKVLELPGIGIFKKSINNKANIVRYNINRGDKDNYSSKSRLNFRINRRIRLLTRDFLD